MARKQRFHFCPKCGGRLALRPGDDLDAAAYLPLAAPPPLAFPTDSQVINMLRGLKLGNDGL